jgi:regulator of replication initiation timing
VIRTATPHAPTETDHGPAIDRLLRLRVALTGMATELANLKREHAHVRREVTALRRENLRLHDENTHLRHGGRAEEPAGGERR